ncbi:MAG TPA: CYTH domain-containing protein [Candidatus Saccharimonadales bacterium]|nr:CYTH domain-containing protein [Candidatus Saccharimonadales bacterium]
MKPEIEAKFLDVPHDALRARLKELGAVCDNPMRLMKRKGFDFPDGRLRREHNGWARVRDEGDKITMSYKQLNNRELDGTHEVQLVIDDFDTGVAFLERLGLVPGTYQETKRESWHLDGCEIELDEWPWAKPYTEMEGPDEATLKTLAAKLGLDWSQVKHGSVEIVYRGEYDITDAEFNTIPIVTFEEPVPEWLEKRRRA